MGILSDAWDFWTKPGLGERLGSLFADNAPMGGERVTRPGEQIDRQVHQQTGGGGSGSSGGSNSDPGEGHIHHHGEP